MPIQTKSAYRPAGRKTTIFRAAASIASRRFETFPVVFSHLHRGKQLIRSFLNENLQTGNYWPYDGAIQTRFQVVSFFAISCNSAKAF
jgi:hypothetical protein